MPQCANTCLQDGIKLAFPCVCTCLAVLRPLAGAVSQVLSLIVWACLSARHIMQSAELLSVSASIIHPAVVCS